MIENIDPYNRTASQVVTPATVSHARTPFYKNLKFYVLTVAVLHSICTSGLSLGWNALLLIYQAEGKYSFLCNDDESSGIAGFNHERIFCDAERQHLAKVFSVAYSVQWFIALPMGLLVDFMGPRIAILGQSIFIAALIGMVSFTPSAAMTVDWNLVSLIFLFGSRYLIGTRYLHYAKLFHEYFNAVSTVLVTSFSISGGVFLLFYGICATTSTSFHTILYYFIGLQFLFVIFALMQPSKAAELHEEIAFSWKEFRFYTYTKQPLVEANHALNTFAVSMELHSLIIQTETEPAENCVDPLPVKNEAEVSDLWKHVHSEKTCSDERNLNSVSTNSGNASYTDDSSFIHMLGAVAISGESNDADHIYFDKCRVEISNEKVEDVVKAVDNFDYLNVKSLSVNIFSRNHAMRKFLEVIRYDEWKFVLTRKLLIFFIHFMVYYFIYTTYLNIVNFQLHSKADGDVTLANKFTFYFSCFIPFGFVLSIWIAVLGDLWGTAYMLPIQVLLCTIHVAFTFMPIVPYQFVTFFSYVTGDDVLYSLLVIALARWIPSRYFCTVYGLAYSCAGALSFVVGAVVLQIMEGHISLTVVYSIFLCLSCLGAFTAAYFLRKGI